MPLSTNAHILVTRKIPHSSLERLLEKHNVHVYEDGIALDEESLISLGKGADAMITMLSDPVTKRVLQACPKLKVIAQYAVGYDNIDLDAASRLGIIVTNTPDVLTDSTADFTFALMLALARHVIPADAYVRADKFRRWETMLLLGSDLTGKTLGIVGMGRIGKAVARRGLAFGMDIIYHNRCRLPPSEEYRLSAVYESMDRLLAQSDFITLHCPLNDESYHLISEGSFDLMKSTTFVINTARGPIIDESALVKALEERKIAGAALDVFEEEPKIHPGLLAADRVVLAPHLASATRETRLRMAEMCADSVLSTLNEAELIPNRVI